MSEDLKCDYTMPILDICAVIIAVVAVIIALYTVYLSNHTRINTENTVNELQLNREELVKIKILLARLNKSVIVQSEE